MDYPTRDDLASLADGQTKGSFPQCSTTLVWTGMWSAGECECGPGFTVSVGKTEISVLFSVSATHREANFGPESG